MNQKDWELARDSAVNLTLALCSKDSQSVLKYLREIESTVLYGSYDGTIVLTEPTKNEVFLQVITVLEQLTHKIAECNTKETSKTARQNVAVQVTSKIEDMMEDIEEYPTDPAYHEVKEMLRRLGKSVITELYGVEP